jgi:hypothetical protein
MSQSFTVGYSIAEQVMLMFSSNSTQHLIRLAAAIYLHLLISASGTYPRTIEAMRLVRRF